MPSRFWTPLKVGLLTILAALALGLGVSLVTKGGLSERNSYEVFAVFENASGLRSKTKVQIAGIEVGQIDGVELVGNKAKVILRIRDDITLWKDAGISKRSEGFIGDMTLDIVPGKEPPRLPDGGEITNVVTAGDMEKVFATLGEITKDIQAVTQQLRGVLGGEDTAGSLRQIIEDVARLTNNVNATIQDSSERLNNILVNFEAISQSAREVASGERATVASILQNADRLFAQLNRAAEDVQAVLGTVKGILGTNEGELEQGVAGLRQSLDKLNSSLTEISEVTGKLTRGESTVGRLLTDDALILQIEETVGDASDFVSRLIDLQAEVSLKSEFYPGHRSSREQVMLRLIPAEDKWYELAVISPLGMPRPETVVTYDPDGTRRETATIVRDTDYEFNALFAHRWRMGGVALTGRVGLIEGSGGLGGSVGLFRERLSLSVDAFQFSERHKPFPRIRAFAAWTFMNHFVVTGGVDDAFNDRWVLPPALAGATEFERMPRDFFLGAGFYFTDDDLKALITTVGLPTP